MTLSGLSSVLSAGFLAILGSALMAGDLHASFGVAGRVVDGSGLGLGGGEAFVLVLQPDGKLFAAGRATTYSTAIKNEPGRFKAKAD